MSLRKTLWRGGRVLSPTSPDATALLTEGDRVVWIGADTDAPPADATVDLADALITPSFVDSHVHLLGTGTSLTGLHLANLPSAEAVLDALAAAAATMPPDAVIVAGGWDETTWEDPTLPDPESIDRAAGGRLAYLSRACGHTGVAGRAYLETHRELAALDGYTDTGVLTRAAHKAARGLLGAARPVAQRLELVQAALDRAASTGITAVAEHAIPVEHDERVEAEFSGLIELGARPDNPTVFGWWGELSGGERARDLGAHGSGGDLSVDGSLGAATAYLRGPYRDPDGSRGTQYLTVEQVRDHLTDSHRFGMAAAFHAIGDAAIETVLDGLDLAEPLLGLDAIRLARHRIEHAELTDSTMTARMVHYGVHASVQPAFDAAWGGPSGMYALRLGKEAALAANPFSHMAGVGVPLAFGSDAPVTPLDPWGGVAAAVRHRNPALRLAGATAFTAATRGGWRALGIDDAGALAPGMRADFAAWDTTEPPDFTDPNATAPECVLTVASGQTIYSRT